MKRSSSVAEPREAPLSQRPRWAAGALSMWALLGLAALALAWAVVGAKMDQRLKAEIDRGWVRPGEGGIGPSIEAIVRSETLLWHLGGEGEERRLSAHGPDGSTLMERRATAELYPVGLGLAGDQVWAALSDGRVAPVDDQLRLGTPLATSARGWRRFSGLPDGRLAGIDSASGAVLLFRPGGEAEQPWEGRGLVALDLEGGPGGLAVLSQGRDKRVQVHVLTDEGRHQFDAMGVAISPYVCVAWSGPQTLIVNDVSGPKGLLAFDALSGRFLGSAQQSRQNDHLFNVAFIAGDPERGGFLIRPALGLARGRLPVPQRSLWSSFPSGALR